MTRIKIYILTISLSIICGTSAFSQEIIQDVKGNAVKFARMLQLIDNFYADSTNIESLTENAIIAMLAQLDPHSIYISGDEVAKMNEPLEGSFEGVGISFNILADTLMVVQAIPGGPSEKIGLMAGDRIIRIDNKNIAGIGLKNSEVTELLRGKKGTKVSLKVVRHGYKDILDFVVIRDKIPIHSLDANYMLDDKIGYIKLNRFSQTTADEVKKAMRELKLNAGFKDLILDLRGNGGGYMSMAIELADIFLDAGKLVVYTEGLNSPRKNYHTSKVNQLPEGKVVIIIDEGSASASEIVSGAIQDWDRGIIVGRRSFGKGLVQQPFPLTDGSIVRLTVSHYYTPSGRGIQKPYNNGIEEYKEDYINRYKTGELFNKDSIQIDESKVFRTLLKNRKVYEGGGIMPDVYTPLDTTINYSYYNELQRKNILYENIMTYQDRNRAKLSAKYLDFTSFNKSFQIEDSFIEAINKRAKKEGIEFSNSTLEFAKPLIKKQAKAIIARDLFEQKDYYKVMNDDDNEIKKAISIIKDSAKYQSILNGK